MTTGDVNYFDLIRENTEVGRRLLDLLSGVRLPPELRPRGSYVHPFSGLLTPAGQVTLRVDGNEDALHVRLVVNGGYLLWQHVFEWLDADPEGIVR